MAWFFKQLLFKAYTDFKEITQLHIIISFQSRELLILLQYLSRHKKRYLKADYFKRTPVVSHSDFTSFKIQHSYECDTILLIHYFCNTYNDIMVFIFLLEKIFLLR